jgi:DNA primase catalytic core
MIEQEKIDRIKTTVDMVALAEARGIRMKKNGRGYFGLCPFHDDKNPSLSINPKTNLWQCFGCGASGDVIRFIELFDRVDFTEAVRILSAPESAPPARKPRQTTNPPKPPSIHDPQTDQYLERIVTLYENNSQKAGAYLEGRGITDAGLLSRFRIGFCNNTLNNLLPREGDIRESLKQMGILYDNNRERFNNCLVIPVCDIDGNIVTLYGRSIKPGSTRPHMFLPDRPKGLWNSSVIKTSAEIILVESITDGLSVCMAGLGNVIALGGTNGLKSDYIRQMQHNGVTHITLLLDGDDAGKDAAMRLQEKLTAFHVTTKTLPDDHDPNSFLQKHGPQELAAFINDPGNGVAVKPVQPVRRSPDGGFVVSCGTRNYQVMSLARTGGKLKVVLRFEHGDVLHLDTLDLYSARARTKLAADLCRKFDQLPETMESDITRIIKACEETDPDPATVKEEPQAPAMTDKEKKTAEAFGRSADLFKNILADFEACGLVGEEANKLLGYVAMTSRKQPKPLSVQILSSSGSGKSALQDAVVGFCPPEDVVKRTSMSGKSLFYKQQTSLKHKLLAVEEGDGAEDAAYALRSLISSGILINETTIKDLTTGRLTTMENIVEGPVAVFYTTTNPDVDPETKSRFFVTGIDESPEQTKRIKAAQLERHSRDDQAENIHIRAVQTKHHHFQRLLQSVGVKNPFGQNLTYGDNRLLFRRDQPKYLSLIKSVAFLRQMQKQVFINPDTGTPCIDTDPEDIRIANHLATEIMGRSLDELSRPGRDLLILLDEMVEQLWQEVTRKKKNSPVKRTDITFNRRTIREHTGWTNTRVHRYLKELVDLEYVLVDCGRNGLKYTYRLAYEGQGKTGEKFLLGLTDPDKLKKG